MKPIKLNLDEFIESGIMTEVEVMPSIDIIRNYKGRMSDVPKISIIALIDTGAKVCGLDSSIIEQLGLEPYMETNVSGHYGTVNSKVYHAIFKIPGKKEYVPVCVVPCHFASEKYKALIGRDFLKYCTFVFNAETNDGYLTLIK